MSRVWASWVAIRAASDPAGQQHPPVASPRPGAASNAEQQPAAEHDIRGVTTRNRHAATHPQLSEVVTKAETIKRAKVA